MRAVTEGVDNDPWSEPWRQLKIKNELATGKYEDAMATLEEALQRFPASIALQLLGATSIDSMVAKKMPPRPWARSPA